MSITRQRFRSSSRPAVSGATRCSNRGRPFQNYLRRLPRIRRILLFGLSTPLLPIGIQLRTNLSSKFNSRLPCTNRGVTPLNAQRVSNDFCSLDLLFGFP